MDSKNIVRSNLGWAFGEKMLSQIISLLVTIILARILDPVHFGTIALVSVFITILDAFVNGGFSNALIQKKNADELDFNTICIFSVVLSIILYLILFVCSPLIESFYSVDSLSLITRILGFKIIITSYNSVQHAYVQKHLEFKKFFFSTLGGTIASGVIGVAMALSGFGVWALIAQYISNSLIDSIVLLFTIKWKPKIQFSFQRFKELFSFGFTMLIATLVNSFQDSARGLIIGKKYSSTDLAFYNQGHKFPSYLMDNLIGSVQRVFFPALSKEQDNLSKIKDFMRSSIRISSFLILPAVFGLIAIADNLVLVIFTSKWSPCVIYLRILSLVYITRTLNTIFQSGLLAIGKSKINMIHEIIGSVVSLSLIVVGVFVLNSIPFIAWSYVISMVIGTLIFVFATRSSFKYGLTEMARDFIPYLVMSLLMGVGVYFVGKININEWLLLFLQILIGLVLYFGLSALLKIKEFEFLKIKILHFIKRDSK